MTPLLQKLLAMQEIDLELGSLRQKIASLPEKLAQSEAEVAGLERAHEEALAQARAVRLKGDQVNLELRSREENLQKHRQHLNIAKSNKEYQILQQECSRLQESIRALEDEGLRAYEEADQLSSQAQASLNTAAAKKQDLYELRPRVEEQTAELEQKLSRVLSRRELAAREIDPEELERYERTLANRQGQALSEVASRVCKACQMSLTPQQYNLLLLDRETIQCPSCHRILYTLDRVGPGTPQTGGSG